jgi:hypothetical protein
MPVIRLHCSSDLREEFRAYGRHSTFSTQAYDWLWDYLCEYEDSYRAPLAINVVGLCCDFSEEDYASIVSSYSNIDLPEREDYDNVGAYDEAYREAILDYLNDNTIVLGYDDDSVLYEAF